MSDPPSIRLFNPLEENVHRFLQLTDAIPGPRKQGLQDLARHFARGMNGHGPASSSFICTHNSRRSQIAQVWASAAAAFFGLNRLRFFSSGTEATAFHPNAIGSLRRAGFHIPPAAGSNPHYRVEFAAQAPPLDCFSKAIGEPGGPEQAFGAILVCSEADAACPIVAGASFRLSLPYEDPGAADGSPNEEEAYDSCQRQIATELLYAMQQVRDQPLSS